MEYRKLGNLEVSVIGLGTLSAFDVTEEADLAPRRQIIDNLLVEDINVIDSAAAYGASEKAVGITTEGRRDKFYLATKVRKEGKEAGENQIAQSFQNFKTGYIDLAGYCLAALVQLDDERAVSIVVLGARSNAGRFAEARRLVDWLSTQASARLTSAAE